MEEFSQNENKMNDNDEIYLNGIVMEGEIMEEEFEIQLSLQIEESINANEGGKTRKENLKEMYFQKNNENLIVKMHYVGHFIV
jgi:hypothetical protein